MKLNAKGISYLLFSLGCAGLSSSAIASSYHKHHYKSEMKSQYEQNHFEVMGAGSIAKLKAGNSSLGVTSNETDTLVQTNESTWNTPGGQLGVGYVYYFGKVLKRSNQVRWFPSVEPQLNLYYLTSDSIHGNVLRYGSTAFNELDYDMPVRSTRLMVDALVTIAKWRSFSFYGKVGVGDAWTRVSYSDQDNGTNVDCPNQSTSLGSRTSSNFAWEAGAGINYAVNDRFGLSLEYLYSDLGTVKTSASGNTGAITAPTISAPSFSLKTQTALLGLHVGI